MDFGGGRVFSELAPSLSSSASRHTAASGFVTLIQSAQRPPGTHNDLRRPAPCCAFRAGDVLECVLKCSLECLLEILQIVRSPQLLGHRDKRLWRSICAVGLG